MVQILFLVSAKAAPSESSAATGYEPEHAQQLSCPLRNVHSSGSSALPGQHFSIFLHN